MTQDPAPSPRRAPAALRAGWIGAGLLSVGVGGIGVVVPGLPTTVFFVFAAWCFSRSSPRLEAWVLGLPGVGQLVADHRAGLGMPRRAKAVAVTMIAAACGLSATVVDQPWVAVAILVTGAVGVAWVLWKVPTREVELARRGARVDVDPGTP